MQIELKLSRRFEPIVELQKKYFLLRDYSFIINNLHTVSEFKTSFRKKICIYHDRIDEVIIKFAEMTRILHEPEATEKIIGDDG